MYFFIKSLGKMSKFSPEVGVNLVDSVPEGFSAKLAELEDAKEAVEFVLWFVFLCKFII